MAAWRGIQPGLVGKAGKAEICLFAMTFSPCPTKARLTPVSGTTSQTVASPTRSSWRIRSGAGLDSVNTPRERSSRSSADKNDEGHPGGAEMTVGTVLVEPVRIDHAVRARQVGTGKVMVDDNDVDSGVGNRRQRAMRRNPAIDRDDQARTAGAQGSSASSFGP